MRRRRKRHYKQNPSKHSIFLKELKFNGELWTLVVKKSYNHVTILFIEAVEACAKPLLNVVVMRASLY